MKENYLVSVVVPIYGVEQFLHECIDSIIKQTYEKLEIILVDDGSLDSCPQICDEYAAKDSRIVVIHKKNGGVVSARTAGVAKAVGEYIQFVDGDDWIAPDMTEKLIDRVLDTQADVVMCSYYFSGDDVVEKKMHLSEGIYDRDAIREKIFPVMLYAGKYYEFGLEPSLWNKLYKRELIEGVLEFLADISFGEDALWVYGLMKNVNMLCVTDAPLYYYRVNMSGTTKSYRRNQTMETKKMLHCMWKLYNEPLWERQCAYYTYYVLMANYHNEAMRCPPSKLYERYKGLKEFAEAVEIKKLVGKYSIKELPVVRRMEMFMISHSWGWLLLSGLVCKNIFRK